jgi:hypothetical protein
MKAWSFADPQTGMFSGQAFMGTEARLQGNVPPGLIAVEGLHDHLSKRLDVNTGAVVDWQPPRPADSEMATHDWDATTQRWVPVPTTAAHWAQVRADRDRRLALTDWLVVRCTERGEPMSQAWRQYRQALRDITQQSDPLAIVWPTPPE